jgi:MFS family permease
MFVAVDATPHRVHGTFSEPGPRLVARAALALLAIWVLHLAQSRYLVFEQHYSRTFHMDGWLWLAWVSTSASAGLLFGLAATFPFSRFRYFSGRLLLAAIAFLPVAEYWFVWGYLLPRRHTIGGWLVTTTGWFGSFGTLFALAVLGGVAVASGFRAIDREPEPRSTAKRPNVDHFDNHLQQ